MAAAPDESPAVAMLPEPPLWHGLVAGPLAGTITRIVVYPADTIKARLQVQGALPGGAALPTRLLPTARAMLVEGGPTSFYRGLGAVLIGIIPANAAYFYSYELGQRLVPATWAGTLRGDVAVGLLAQALAGLVYTPIDVVKERLQVQGLAAAQGDQLVMYRGALHAYRALLYGEERTRIATTTSVRSSPAAAAHPPGCAPVMQRAVEHPAKWLSGPNAAASALRRVLRGYWMTNCVWLPWNAAYIAGYEQGKRAAAEALGCSSHVDELPAWVIAACSASAAGAAALVTHPADVVKTRLQVLSATPGGAQLSAGTIARAMLVHEGAGAFFRGLGARMLNIAPGCALSWALYEKVKRVLHEHQGRLMAEKAEG